MMECECVKFTFIESKYDRAVGGHQEQRFLEMLNWSLMVHELFGFLSRHFVE